MNSISICPEWPVDVADITSVVEQAFRGHPHRDQTEQLIVVLALCHAGALAVSLVAEADGQIVGHVAFSPVEFRDNTTRVGLGWDRWPYCPIGSVRVLAKC